MLERLNLSKIQDLEMKQKELIILKENNKKMVANLSQHIVKIKELEDLQKNHLEIIKQFNS